MAAATKRRNVMTSCMMLVVGLTIGIVVNHNGLLFESLAVRLPVIINMLH